jgi:hypothetical protein
MKERGKDKSSMRKTEREREKGEGGKEIMKIEETKIEGRRMNKRGREKDQKREREGGRESLIF